MSQLFRFFFLGGGRIFIFFIFFLEKSVSYQKKDGRGMATTQAIRDLFVYRSSSVIWIVHFSLEMMDKVDPPGIPDGYSLSLAFLAMLDVTRCVQVHQINVLISSIAAHNYS